MAENNQAEQKPQAEEKKEEKQEKKIGTLESVVNESFNFVKTGINLGLAGLIPYTQGSLFPEVARDTAILAGSQIAGDTTTNFRRGKKTTANEILKSSLVGTAMAAPSHYAFKYVNQIPLDSALGYVSRGAAFGGLIAPTFIGMYQSVDYLVRNLTFKGLGKYLKENYWPTVKKFWTRILPFSLANIFFVPAYLQIPVAAGLQYLFTLFGAPKKGELKEEEKRDKTSYLVAAASAGTKLVRNTFKGFYDAISGIGSYIGEKLYKPAPAKPAAPAPQSAK